jgi:hypothetical protein
MNRDIANWIDLCRSESNLDIQVALLFQINEKLPEELHIKLPSLLTNDYVLRALDIIEDKLTRYESSLLYSVR